MAVINPIRAQRTIDTGSIPGTQIDDSIGQGLRAVGQSVQQAGATLSDIDIRQQRMKNQADEFKTDQSFRRFEDDNALVFDKTKMDIDPSGEGFTANISKQITQRSDEFLKTVPANLRPKFAELANTAREEWLNKASRAEIDQRNTWYRDGIQKTLEGRQTQVFNDPTLFDAAKSDGYRAIDASGLPETEKKKLKESWDETLSVTVGEREIRDTEADPARAATAAARLGVPSAAAGEAKRFLLTRTDKDGSHISGLNDGFATKLATMIEAAPPNVKSGLGIYSGARSNSRQAELWQQALKKYGSPEAARKWVAPPGKSNHNRGLAADLSYNGQSLKNAPKDVVDWVHANAERFGLKFPLGNEDWHIEDSATRGGARTDAPASQGQTPADAAAPSEDPRYANLSLAKRLEIYDRTMAAAQRGQTAITAQAKADYQSMKGTMELGIQTGDLSSSQQILTSSLSDSDKATMLKALQTRQGETMATGEAVSLFSAGNLRVDPYDAKGRKTVDNAWTAVSQAVPTEQLQATAEEMVRQTGVVPQSVVNNIRQGLTSTDINAVMQAAQMAQRISTVDPAALGRRDGGSDAQKAADDFSFYVNRLNLSPEDAARRLADNRDPEKQRDRKALEPAAKEFLKAQADTDLGSVFDDSFLGFRSNPSVGLTPAQEAGIKADYLAIAEDQFYQANGDPQLAQNRAVEEMKRLYGVTEFGGVKAIVKHPPEKYWPASTYQGAPDVTIDPKNPGAAIGAMAAPVETASSPSLEYAKRQLQTDISAIQPNADMSTVQLVTTPETDAMVKRGEMPGYAVLYKDKDGMYQTIPGKLWRPDFSKAIEAQRAADQASTNAAVDFARGQQDIERQKAIEQGNDGGRSSSLDAFVNGPVKAPKPQPMPKPVTPAGQVQDQRSQLFKNAQDAGTLSPQGILSGSDNVFGSR